MKTWLESFFFSLRKETEVCDNSHKKENKCPHCAHPLMGPGEKEGKERLSGHSLFMPLKARWRMWPHGWTLRALC